MLVIRLRRIGRKHDPHYRIVVAEHTSPVQGKFVAEIGHYHPKNKELGIDKAAFTDWMNKGAKPSNTVSRIAQRAEIEHKHIVTKQVVGQPKAKALELAAKKAEKAAAPAPVEAPAEEVVAEEPTVEADAPEEAPAADEAPAEAEEVAATEEAPTEEVATEEATNSTEEATA